MPTKSTREIRMAAVSVVQDTANDERVVEGRAIVFGAPTVLYEFDGIQYKEVVERGALDGADLSDVPFKYNHSDHVMIMARTRNNTLELTVDDQGLLIRAKLADTSAGRDMYELVKRSDITEMSFAFTVTESSYNKETHTRSIKKIKRIWDVAAVDTPAYQDTYIKARSFFEAEAEKEQRAAEAANRARILTKIKLMTMEERT
jgi:uncharacterized protein